MHTRKMHRHAVALIMINPTCETNLRLLCDPDHWLTSATGLLTIGKTGSAWFLGDPERPKA